MHRLTSVRVDPIDQCRDQAAVRRYSCWRFSGPQIERKPVPDIQAVVVPSGGHPHPDHDDGPRRLLENRYPKVRLVRRHVGVPDDLTSVAELRCHRVDRTVLRDQRGNEIVGVNHAMMGGRRLWVAGGYGWPAAHWLTAIDALAAADRRYCCCTRSTSPCSIHGVARLSATLITMPAEKLCEYPGASSSVQGCSVRTEIRTVPEDLADWCIVKSRYSDAPLRRYRAAPQGRDYVGCTARRCR